LVIPYLKSFSEGLTCIFQKESMKKIYLICSLLIFILNVQGQKLKVAVAGLTHDHVHQVMQAYTKNEVIITGIAESDQNLVQRYKQQYKIPDSLFFQNLPAAIGHQRPDVVLAYNAISEHIQVVETAAPLGLSVMVEKPLAMTVKQAERMAALSKQFKVHVLTNYETTWYSSNQELNQLVNDSNSIGRIGKMVVHDGHQGPKEIRISNEFFAWLTDPEKNGAGALVDFGCYGANLMTWLMKGEAPVAVTAITRRIKPEIYPKVDDDATVLLEYPGATGIIEASWNWPYGIKDLEVFGKTGYIQAVNGNTLRIREKENLPYTIRPAAATALRFKDHFEYLSAVLKGEVVPGRDLSSLENNLLVVKILAAAKRSAKEGKRIELATFKE
jgi:predicted dehydrogenase